MRTDPIRSSIAVGSLLALGLAACGSDDGEDSSGDNDANAADVPTIVVTTNILGDVVGEVVGDSAEVVTIMPVGADPHDFQASAQEVDAMTSADALIVNGASFEEGLVDVIENAEGDGVPTFEAISAVDTIEFGEGAHDHDEHADEDHSDEEHSEEEHSDDEHDHDHSGVDPHFFNDPARMAVAVEGIVDFLQDEIEFADPAALDESAASYVAELTALDSEIEELVGAVPEDGRVLVTNHEVFGYFADRYGYEIVGAVIPGGGTTDSVSAAELSELAEVIVSEGVPAIFSDTSASDDLIQTLADEVGDVEVVALFTESLGDADSGGATYLEMQRTNGERISSALS